MTDIIHLLPDSVANQIAAGEVIQRPASVIKELVENSVDAGATTISVLLVDAGRTLIQVIDNGQGMTETDARMAFERHATSKISHADDLFSLHTMGFRGEALPSIASVAQVELRTRTADDDLGTCLRLAASRVVSHEPCACPPGCSFRVENLFYNVPARRRFLKSDKTELSQSIEVFERIALVYPDINFTFHSNGSRLFDLRRGPLLQRIIDIFGPKLRPDLLPVEVDTTFCRITGFTGKPESSEKRCKKQFFFVNGRYMRHPFFHKAVLTAYERLLPAEQQPPYFLYFEVKPEDIDVNVHPTKTEIKFENEQSIWQILLAAVREAVGRFSEIPKIDFDADDRPEIPVFASSEGFASDVHGGVGSAQAAYNPFNQAPPSTRFAPRDWEELYPKRPAAEPAFFSPLEEADEEQQPFADKSTAHYQYKGRYIMTAVKSGLMVLDQHRAHVRILYEQYLSQIQNRKATSQRLLFPESVQFGASDAVRLDAVISEMNSVGFDLTPLGAGAYGIMAVPAGLEGLNPQALVEDMVAEALEKDTAVAADLHASLALSMARKAATPYGQVLSNEEMENLITQLFACQNIHYTPDGRPVLTLMEQSAIDNLFQ